MLTRSVKMGRLGGSGGVDGRPLAVWLPVFQTLHVGCLVEATIVRAMSSFITPRRILENPYI